MLASLFLGFNNTYVELEWASLNSVRAIEYVLCTKFILLRNFVPQKENLWISKLILFFTSQSRVKAVQSLIWSAEAKHDNKKITA